jgi:hypothetical protein
MSDDLSPGFFAPPPFKAAEAWMGLQRQLRDLRLSERAGQWEFQGQALLRLSLDEAAGQLRAEHALRSARGNTWKPLQLNSASEVRQLLEAIKRQLSRQRDDE